MRQGLFQYPATAMGKKISPRDTPTTNTREMAGRVVFNGAAGVTFTLPTIVDDGSPGTSTIGMEFEMFNVSANAATVATTSSQLINNVASLTSVSCPAQTKTTFVASKTFSGALIWTVDRSTIVTS